MTIPHVTTRTLRPAYLIRVQEGVSDAPEPPLTPAEYAAGVNAASAEIGRKLGVRRATRDVLTSYDEAADAPLPDATEVEDIEPEVNDTVWVDLVGSVRGYEAKVRGTRPDGVQVLVEHSVSGSLRWAWRHEVSVLLRASESEGK